jgi:hypothetical protein
MYEPANEALIDAKIAAAEARADTKVEKALGQLKVWFLGSIITTVGLVATILPRLING